MRRLAVAEFTPEEFAQECAEAALMQPGDLPDAFADVTDIIRRGIADNFSMEQTADGIGWPARKRIGDGHPLLEELTGPGAGALKAAALGEGPGAVERIVDGCELQLGVEKIDLGGLPGAAVHQFGYPDKNIPQREYLAMSEATIDETIEAMADHLLMGVV